MALKLFFVGTGGGRFVTLTQRRWTGGIRLVAEDGFHAHLDPGPGALVYSIWMRLSPRRLRAVMVSHCHVDHYADSEVMIEAMTGGMTRKRGLLVASRSVLRGNETCGPAISRYHQSMPEAVVEAAPGKRFTLGRIRALVTEARHSDPDTVGFRLESRDVGDICYTSDTEYFEGIGRYYGGARLLLLCTLRPHGRPWAGHMTTDDAVRIVVESEPEAAIITHFGMRMLAADPELEARLIKERTGVPTIGARDRMRVEVGETIEVYSGKKRLTLV
ncbi:TPA: MBL fold metallo-hydrolase [Candidatus Bathyarchaeota archaeon]|nr:MBL fold metallo-hydrolase [Candidatus Bathyarchaeota archaeon]